MEDYSAGEKPLPVPATKKWKLARVMMAGKVKILVQVGHPKWAVTKTA